MKTTHLKTLIKNGETPKVDFKREWYKKEELTGEFIKDIFALANGDIHTINDKAYLIIGISDQKRTFFDFETDTIPRFLEKLKQQLLTNLNNYAQPEFLSLEMEWVEIEKDNEVLVLSVAPHGRLISLTKDLQLKKRTDKKGTTYYRVGEDIRVASVEVVRDFEKAYSKDENSNGVNITINGEIKGIGVVNGGVVNQTIS